MSGQTRARNVGIGGRERKAQAVPAERRALHSVGLTGLMEKTCGVAEVVVGLIDGPVEASHPDLVDAPIRDTAGVFGGACAHYDGPACRHGTFVAGILSARRASTAPAISPGCTLVVRPIFDDRLSSSPGGMPSAAPGDLAGAIIDTVRAGCRVINISAAIAQPSTTEELDLAHALDFATKKHTLVIAAAGNQGTLGSTAITRHPWVVTVVAYDSQSRPMSLSNVGHSIGRNGLGAPGDRIVSLGTEGRKAISSGTSAAAPFVTGSVALLWSQFPGATAAEMRMAITNIGRPRHAAVVPPLLDVPQAYQYLRVKTRGRAS